MSSIQLRDLAVEALRKRQDAHFQKLLTGRCESLEEYKGEVARHKAYEDAIKVVEELAQRMSNGGVRADESLPARRRVGS